MHLREVHRTTRQAYGTLIPCLCCAGVVQKKKTYVIPFSGIVVSPLFSSKSGRLELNQRPLGPEPSALARLSYAPLYLSQ